MLKVANYNHSVVGHSHTGALSIFSHLFSSLSGYLVLFTPRMPVFCFSTDCPFWLCCGGNPNAIPAYFALEHAYELITKNMVDAFDEGDGQCVVVLPYPASLNAALTVKCCYSGARVRVVINSEDAVANRLSQVSAILASYPTAFDTRPLHRHSFPYLNVCFFKLLVFFKILSFFPT